MFIPTSEAKFVPTSKGYSSQRAGGEIHYYIQRMFIPTSRRQRFVPASKGCSFQRAKRSSLLHPKDVHSYERSEVHYYIQRIFIPTSVSEVRSYIQRRFVPTSEAKFVPASKGCSFQRAKRSSFQHPQDVHSNEPKASSSTTVGSHLPSIPKFFDHLRRIIRSDHPPRVRH